MTQVPARTDKIVIVDDDARIRDSSARRYLTQGRIRSDRGRGRQGGSTDILLRDTVDLIVRRPDDAR